jgi:hypothetical protein
MGDERLPGTGHRLLQARAVPPVATAPDQHCYPSGTRRLNAKIDALAERVSRRSVVTVEQRRDPRHRRRKPSSTLARKSRARGGKFRPRMRRRREGRWSRSAVRGRRVWPKVARHHRERHAARRAGGQRVQPGRRWHAPRQRLHERTIRLRLRRRRKLAAVGRDDTLAPASALEGHPDAHDKGVPVEPNALGTRCPSPH